MTRISTHGTSRLYLSYIMKLQSDSSKSQSQVATGMKSQTYSGISNDANQLLNFEHEKALSQQYITNANNATTRLNVASTTLEAVDRTMRDFRDRLQEFYSSTTIDQNQVEDVQKWAFSALKDMQSYMLTDVDGQYIFGGSRTDTEPVQFNYTTVDDFQTTYDGQYNTYPTTRDAHLFEMDLTATQSGQVSFDTTAGTMQSDGTVFDNVPVGAKLTIGGTNAGTYTVTANDGGSPAILTLSPAPPTTAANATDVTVNADSWYKGDSTPTNVQVDNDRTVDTGLFANDPAFEKAIRAMGIIAQGGYGTTGGLDQNLNRVGEALFLIKDAIDAPAGETPPYGDELPSDIKTVSSTLGFTQNMLKTKIELHQDYMSFLETRISDIQNADKTEAIVRMQDDQTALQASYQALAQVRSLSLLDYVK